MVSLYYITTHQRNNFFEAGPAELFAHLEKLVLRFQSVFIKLAAMVLKAAGKLHHVVLLLTWQVMSLTRQVMCDLTALKATSKIVRGTLGLVKNYSETYLGFN